MGIDLQGCAIVQRAGLLFSVAGRLIASHPEQRLHPCRESSIAHAGSPHGAVPPPTPRPPADEAAEKAADARQNPDDGERLSLGHWAEARQ
jgi:hypothetical protein